MTTTLPPLRSDPATAGLPGRRPIVRRPWQPLLDVVIPVYNEQNDLEPCVRRLHEYLTRTLPYSFRITIADNASTDATLAIAETLQAAIDEVVAVHLDEKGRGRALRAVWSNSDAPILAYMDVDLSTDLAALLPLIAPLISGHSDLAIGSRLAHNSRIVRGARREVISRGYNMLLRRTLSAGFSDAQCGFKAIRKDVAEQLLPFVTDNGWFFDTELLVVAERIGLRICEVPVDWIDDPDSRVDIVSTALADLRGVVRLSRAFATGALPVAELRRQLGRRPLDPAVPGVPRGLAVQATRFAAIGVLSTLAYLGLYLIFRGPAGPQAANLLALLLTAIVNTAANRRLTFGVSGRTGAGRSQIQGLLVFALALGLTSGSLAALPALDPQPGRVIELTVLVAANAAATVLRFVLFRSWVFAPRRRG